MKVKKMNKMEEIERVMEIAEEDSCLGNLLKGFEDRFEEIVLGDEYFNLKEELEKRDRKIEELEKKVIGEDIETGERIRQKNRVKEYDKLYASQIIGFAEALHENESDSLKRVFLEEIIRFARLVGEDR